MTDDEKRIEVERITDAVSADMVESLRAAIKKHETKELPLKFIHSVIAYSVETDVQEEACDLFSVAFDVPNLYSLIELVNAVNEEVTLRLAHTKDNKNAN